MIYCRSGKNRQFLCLLGEIIIKLNWQCTRSLEERGFKIIFSPPHILNLALCKCEDRIESIQCGGEGLYQPSRGGGGETVKDIFYVTIHAGIYKSTRRTYMYNNQSLYFFIIEYGFSSLYYKT